MSGIFLLDLATLALSLFNTLLLLWLGLSVLLNAERRSWGIWLTGGGLLSGAIFFLSHTALLGQGLSFYNQGSNFWWHVGWVPVVISPYAWYTVMLWYSGFWEAQQSSLRHRHSLWFVTTSMISSVILGLLILSNPLPSFSQVSHLNLTTTLSVFGIPLLIFSYPVYLVFCIGLALDALIRPGPAARIMAQTARQRARPWLIAASAALFTASILVGWAMFWIVSNTRQSISDSHIGRTISEFDFSIALIIAIATILMGQAVMSYEVFTGKTLPSRGLFVDYRRALILSAGFATIAGTSLNLSLHPVYSLLLSGLLIVVFYALLNWRLLAERQRLITSLRPFVANQQLVEKLLSPSYAESATTGAEAAFKALCETVLETRSAYLFPLGSLSPLFGPPLSYPANCAPVPAPSTQILAQVDSPQTLCVPLESDHPGGASWAIPLWGEHGLTGLLMLGEKRQSGLYSQEEIEIARSIGERLMDVQASSEMAKRLMSLQRQRLAETQVLDQQTRRVLHDDVLPRLHAALLDLSNKGKDPRDSSKAIPTLVEVHYRLSQLLREIPVTTAPEVAWLGLFGAIRQYIEDEMKGAFDTVTWEVAPAVEHEADSIPALIREVIFYATRETIRNAAQHARDTDNGLPLNLKVMANWRDGLEITLEDNGVGIDPVRPSNGNNGQGLALHSTMMAVIGGSLSVESLPGEFTRVSLFVPHSL